MKINLKLLLLGLCALSFLPSALAQVTVVRKDGNKIYLDTSDYNRAIHTGDTFKVILSQEKLTNPKTGKDLGLVNHYSGEGKIVEVQPLYAIGEIAEPKVAVGQEVLLQQQAATQNAALESTDATAKPVAARKMISYDTLEREIISAVRTNLGAAEEEIAALDNKGNVVVYTVNGNALQQTAQYKLPVGYKSVTLSAKDIMQSGQEQLFVVAYKEAERKISTFVLKLENNDLKQIDSLPYFVKELGCGQDKEIYAQRPFIQSDQPGNAYKLKYEKNRFQLDKDSFSTRHNWLSGLNRYEVEAEDIENLIYTAYNGRLRMQLKNHRFVESPALFATAPYRVKYKQEILSFYPALQVYGPKGKATLAAIQNTTKLGLLSEQFGQYNGGKIHFLTYENGSLAVQETVLLKGFAYDTACTARGILIPQVLPSGQTVLTEIYR